MEDKSYTCPYCFKQGKSIINLRDHCWEEHSNECPYDDIILRTYLINYNDKREERGV
jgi:hypothetical protein